MTADRQFDSRLCETIFSWDKSPATQLEQLTEKISPMRNSITDLRIVGAAEGISFLLLLGVAMPMKYFAGMPLAVRIVGTLHGVLFLLYLVAVFRAARLNCWSWVRIVEAIWASLYPFGTFLLDRKLRDGSWSLPNGSRGATEPGGA